MNRDILNRVITVKGNALIAIAQEIAPDRVSELMQLMDRYYMDVVECLADENSGAFHDMLERVSSAAYMNKLEAIWDTLSTKIRSDATNFGKCAKLVELYQRTVLPSFMKGEAAPPLKPLGGETVFSGGSDGVASPPCACPEDARVTVQDKSYSVCTKCGKLTYLTGIMFQDTTGALEAKTRPDDIRHYETWIDLIFGRESTQFPPDIVIKLRGAIRPMVKTRNDLLAINGKTFRRILKTLGLSKLNNHCTKLRHVLTELEIVIPPYEELETNKAMFLDAMRAYEIVQASSTGEKRAHKNYYPYFIMKCFEIQYRNAPQKMRILRDYIHIQNPETVVDSDRTWCKMCRVLNWTYSPTLV